MPIVMLAFRTLLLLPAQLATSAAGIAGESLAVSNPSCDSSSFSYPVLDGVTVTSLSVTLQTNYSTPSSDLFPSFANLNFCEVNIHLTHTDADDDVLVRVWLPSTRDDWNSRFQVTGGGGFATSLGFVGLAPAVLQGYAAVSTDGGHDEWSWTSLEWVLNPDRSMRWDLWHNFIQRSVVEQISIGKDIVEQYYGERPRFSYWNGCSQGGRQGYMLAQRFPTLLDGILAAAPALDLVSISMGGFWPQLIMKESDTHISQCEFAYFTKKTMEICDGLDGFEDGVVIDPDDCNFDPWSLVGNSFDCNGNTIKVTSAMADVVRKIRDGPRSPLGAMLWHGLTPGTDYATLANIGNSPEGVRSGIPVALPLIEDVLLPPNVALSSLTLLDYFALWAQASVEWQWTMQTESTDLTALRDSGTKLLTWHGVTDDIIPHEATIQYRKRVQRSMGGADEVDSFYRLFLAPGVGHCALGRGPLPTDPLAALVDWVENGQAPEVLDAATVDESGETITRHLCKWPAKPVYIGVGDPKRASSWTCSGENNQANLVCDSDAHCIGRT